MQDAGAAHVIATGEQDLVAEVARLTGKAPPRIAFDPVGGPTVEKLAQTLAFKGLLFQYGALATEPTPLPLMAVLGKSLTVRGYTLFEFTQNPSAPGLREGIDFVLAGLASGKLTPVVGKTFPFDEIVEAHRYMEANEQIGKIVVTL